MYTIKKRVMLSDIIRVLKAKEIAFMHSKMSGVITIQVHECFLDEENCLYENILIRVLPHHRIAKRHIIQDEKYNIRRWHTITLPNLGKVLNWVELVLLPGIVPAKEMHDGRNK